jgi:anti-sigma factor RsiW
MNDPTLIGPCADYEHDLMELHDGALPLDRAGAVRLHVEQCPRCRDWAEAFALLDARLAADLAQPRLTAEFDARLQERLAALTRPSVRGGLRNAIEREHDALVDGLRRGARRSALLGAIGWASAMACAILMARDLSRATSGVLATVTGSAEPWMVFSVVGVAISVAGLAWSVVRGGLPTPSTAGASFPSRP